MALQMSAWHDTVGQVDYLVSTGERPVHYMYTPPDGTVVPRVDFESRAVFIRDARAQVTALDVDQGGFELMVWTTAMRDFYDEGHVKRMAYPEAANIALAATGAQEAHVFDHVVRRREPGRPPLTFGRTGTTTYPGAVGRVHVDYTEASGQRRLGLVLRDRARAAAVRRFAIVNVWRSIASYPLLDTPLAVCDARTIAPSDLVASETRYATRTGEIYVLTHHAGHAWSYFPAMRRDEVLVLKQYDSSTSGVARFTPHAAFDHPDMPPDARLRQSIELRCLVLYG